MLFPEVEVTNWLSNILYRMQIKPQEETETLMIDSNEILDNCIEERQKIERERKRLQSIEEGQEGMEEEVAEEDTFSPLSDMPLEEKLPEEPTVDYVEEAQKEAEQILEEAKQQAEEILAQAQQQAEALKSQAEAKGQKAGYEQGIQEAYQKQTLWEAEAEELRQRLEGEYREKQQHIEKELITTVCSVVEKVFLVQFGDCREIILHLVENTLSNIDSSKEFLIRVNEENAELLRSRKAEMQEKVGQEVILDIVQDPLLDETQCMIETDGGLFDCGMDTQLKNLIKEIKSLS